MIAFITICYSAIVWLIFIKLKLLPWNRGSQGAVAGVGVFGILALVFAMNLYQPFSTDVRVYQQVVQIVPRVTGRVIEVPVRANAPVKAGDVLFRIDPEPFQYEVDRLEADMAIKKAILEDANALAIAQVAADIQRDRAQAAHDQTRALLANARLDLRETVVYASADGVVTNLSLHPGQIATRMASLPVMTLVATHQPSVVGTFAQSALEFVQVGDEVEIVLDRLPGRVLEGRVEALIAATGQGQLPPSGILMEWTQAPVAGRMAVRFQLEGDDRDLEIPAGTAGVAAVYTDRATAIRIIRKVVVRMNTWLNYLIL